jgi:hypothetical protein
MAKKPGIEAWVAERYRVSSEAFTKAAGIIYPSAIERFEQDLNDAGDQLGPKLKNEKETFYLLRNCKDFTEPGTAPTAIRELLLP